MEEIICLNLFCFFSIIFVKVYIKMVVNINLIVMNFIGKYKKVLIKSYF